MVMEKMVGYARVSSKEQNLDRQLIALKEFGIDEDMIVYDKASGKNLERPGYMSLRIGLGKLVQGDTLVVCSLDRLSRSKKDICNELEYFKNNHIRLVVLDIATTQMQIAEGQEWIIELINTILFQVLASMAEQERLTIKKRQREGIDAMKIDTKTGKRISKKTGNVVGRPIIEYPQDWEKVYFDWKAGNITAVRAMKILSLKKNSFYKLVHKYEENF